jgi:hypothetical protein
MVPFNKKAASIEAAYIPILELMKLSRERG